MNFVLILSLIRIYAVGEMSWLRKILRLGSRARIMGTDLNGNQYLETEARGMYTIDLLQVSFQDFGTRTHLMCIIIIHCVGGQRARRTVRMVGVTTEDQYTEGSIPHEWERMLTINDHITMHSYIYKSRTRSLMVLQWNLQ